ncbi:MAG: GNAT family N-acetyltransferase [Bacilli bacterium]|nr:GNAT family N-acetyltransferase [Bacilli bacterium]
MKKIFESTNIIFAEVSNEFINDYIEMLNDYEKVGKYFSESHEPYTVEGEIQWVKSELEEKAVVFSMVDKKTKKFIGNTELMDVKDGTGELGIVITGSMQEKGYGKEAIKALTNYGFNVLGLNRIFLRTRINNLRAIHVYKACGFSEYTRDDVRVFMEMFKK